MLPPIQPTVSSSTTSTAHAPLPGVARHPDPAWPGHIGLLNDYLRIPYANGSSFATQFLYREFRARGHRVTVVGPHDPQARPEELPERSVSLAAVPLRMHPGVHLPLPTPRGLARVAAQRFDLVLGQSASELIDLGVWLRATHHIPFLCVNTVHLPAAYNVLLPDNLLRNRYVNGWFRDSLIPWLERHSADVYNQTDGLIVLCRGLEQYWRDRGVRSPIHVVPRSVEPKIFDRVSSHDPFAPHARRGGRLLCVCRHTREKDVSRLISLFAHYVLPRRPDATLTLVGDGPDHDAFREHAKSLGLGERVIFTGELAVTEMPAFYRNADLFVYPSLSETYGQVVSEALWCGLPVVAFADGMGVSDQIEHDQTGFLVVPGPDRDAADKDLAGRVIQLLQDPSKRRALAERAWARTRVRVHPSRIMEMYYSVFEHARRHCCATTEQRVQQPLLPFSAIARWTAVQIGAAGLGCIRPATVVNRHGCRQPGWEELEPKPAHEAVPSASIVRTLRARPHSFCADV